MEVDMQIVVDVQFKVVLKEIMEKLRLPPAVYVCEQNGPDHNPSFTCKIIYEDSCGVHEQIGLEANTKKKAENYAALRAIKHLKNIYDVIIKDVNEKELRDVKYELEELKDINDILSSSLAMMTTELEELKNRIRQHEAEQSEHNMG